MRVYKIFIFILGIIVLLGLLCVFFPKNGISIGEKRLFFPTMEDIMHPEIHSNAKDKLDALEAGLRMDFVMDSVAQAKQSAYNDSLSFYTNFFENHPARFHLPNNDYSFFNDLFYSIDKSLKNNEIIHILHYGDSQIEADRITGLIRQKFQEQFGGNGPGLIPAIQLIPTPAVSQTASGNMKRYTIAGSHTRAAEHNRYGILGQTVEIYGEGTINVSSRNQKSTFENAKEFSTVRVFVSRNSQDFSVSLQTGNDEPIVKTIQDERIIPSTLTWKFKNPIRKFVMNFSGYAEISAISLDGNSGVAVDNIPLRGSSGTFFTSIDVKTLVPVLEELNVKLIIMEYGGNRMPSIKSSKAIIDYTKSIAKQINFFNEIYPAAKILFIGPSDMAKMHDGRLQTYPYLRETVQGIKETALENGAAFWNMFEVMGGENSMIEWVRNSPPWASPDYIHFSHIGSNKIAEMFYESLMIYYNYTDYVNNPQ